MNDETRVRELHKLLDRWCEGTISELEIRRVNELIRGDRRMAREYLCYMELHGSLQCSLDAGPSAVKACLPHSPITAAGSSANVVSRLTSRAARFAALAAAVACALIASAFLLSRQAADNANNSQIGAPMVAARLISTADCRWKTTAERIPAIGGEFRCNEQIEIESGLVQIRSAQGAAMTLRGPARLVFTGPNSVLLESGNLTGEVPDAAKGFTVETPASRIVDFGTEFGVLAEDDGQTALSVFQGAVEVAPRQAAADTKAMRVIAGQALRIDRRGVPGEMQTVDPRQFGLVCRAADAADAANIPDRPDTKILHVDLQRLRSADELRISGELIVAVNVGGNEPVAVGRINFAADDGSYVTSPVRTDPWGTLPWLGDSPDNLALCKVLHSIRYNFAAQNQPGDVSLSIPLPNGVYRLHLLLSENYHACDKRFTDRSINIDLEGEPCIRDMRMLAVQGIAGYPLPPTQAVLLRCDLRVGDGRLDAVLFSKDVAPDIDANVILNAFIVERIN